MTSETRQRLLALWEREPETRPSKAEWLWQLEDDLVASDLACMAMIRWLEEAHRRGESIAVEQLAVKDKLSDVDAILSACESLMGAKV